MLWDLSEFGAPDWLFLEGGRCLNVPDQNRVPMTSPVLFDPDHLTKGADELMVAGGIDPDEVVRPHQTESA